MAVSIVLPLAFCVSLLSLLHFHSYLAWKGMTTFDWIVARRRRETQKRLDRMKEQRKRHSSDSQRHSIVLHHVGSHSTVPAQLEAVTQIQQKYAEFEHEVNGIADTADPPRTNTNGLVLENGD